MRSFGHGSVHYVAGRRAGQRRATGSPDPRRVDSIPAGRRGSGEKKMRRPSGKIRPAGPALRALGASDGRRGGRGRRSSGLARLRRLGLARPWRCSRSFKDQVLLRLALRDRSRSGAWTSSKVGSRLVALLLDLDDVPAELATSPAGRSGRASSLKAASAKGSTMRSLVNKPRSPPSDLEPGSLESSLGHLGEVLAALDAVGGLLGLVFRLHQDVAGARPPAPAGTLLTVSS